MSTEILNQNKTEVTSEKEVLLKFLENLIIKNTERLKLAGAPETQKAYTLFIADLRMAQTYIEYGSIIKNDIDTIKSDYIAITAMLNESETTAFDEVLKYLNNLPAIVDTDSTSIKAA